MLNPFPSLLDFTYFTPTLLRIGAACMFGYLLALQYRDRVKISQLQYPLLSGPAIFWLAVIVDVLIIGALLIGWNTQYAAIAGSILSILGMLRLKRDTGYFPLPPSTFVLLLVICLSLLMTGAGAFAFDIRL